DEDRRRAAGQRHVLVAPVEQRDHHWPQVEALLGEEVLVAAGMVAVLAALEDVLVDQALQACGEHVPGDAERPLHLAELATAQEHLADDQDRPALADQLEAASDRAGLSLVVVAKHSCDLRTLGCIMQLTVVGSRPSEVASSNPRLE